MKPTTLVPIFSLAAALALAGCRTQNDDNGRVTADRVDRGEIRAGESAPMDAALRDATLRNAGVSDSARMAILDDLGDLTPVDAEMQTTEAGRLYRVVYVVEGQTHERWYDANGRRMERAPVTPGADPQTAGQELPPVRPSPENPPQNPPQNDPQ